VPVAVFALREGEPFVGVTLVVVGAVIALSALTRRGPRDIGTWLALIATLALSLAVTGPATTATLLISVMTWALILGVRCAPGWPDRARATRPAVAPSFLAAVILVTGGRLAVAFGLLAVALAIVVIATRFPIQATRIVGVGEKVGSWIATAIEIMLMIPVGLLMCVIWVCHRLLRFDPLASPTEPDSRWVERESSDRFPERLYARVRVAEPRRALTSLHRAAFRVVASLAVIILLYAAIISVTRPADLGPVSFARDFASVLIGPGSQVLHEDPHWQEIVVDNSIFVRHAVFDPVTVFRFADIQTRWVNQVGGARETWRPPPCRCTRHSVWVFGGSVAWGYFQRDSDSPASQIAKAAWEDGIALDITNFALPAFMLGQESRLLGQLLATEPHPDLLVFLDGANEVIQQSERSLRQEGNDDSEMVERTVEEIIDNAIARPLVESVDGWAGNPGYRTPKDAETPTPFEMGVHAGDRYSRNLTVVTSLADAADIPVVMMWQPFSSTAPASLSVVGPFKTRTTRTYWQELYRGALSRVPPEVVDLSDALDDAPRPIFADLVHTNALGAEILGRRMYQEVRSQLPGDAAN